MGGFGSLLGGMGTAALDYGQQIRGLLESRREKMANIFTQAAEQEVDPQRRAALYGHVSDLLSGKDMSKIVPGVAKTLQNHVQSDAVLAQAFGGTPTQPKPQPGPSAPGQTPGTPNYTSQPGQPLITNWGSALGGEQAPQPSAAQPASNPISPASQAGELKPISPAPAQNGITGVPDTLGGYKVNDLMQTPAGRSMLQPLLSPYISNAAELDRQKQFAQFELENKAKALSAFKSQPEYQNLPDWYKGQIEIWAATPGQQLPSMLASLMGVHQESIQGSDGQVHLVNVDRMGNVGSSIGDKYIPPVVTQTPNGGMQLNSRTTGAHQADLENATPPALNTPIVTQTPGGGEQLTSRRTGASIAPVQNGVAPVMNTPHTAPTATGGVELYTPGQLAQGRTPTPIPGAVTTSMLPHQTSREGLVTTVGHNGETTQVVTPFHTSRTVGGVGGGSIPSATGNGNSAQSAPSSEQHSDGRSFPKALTPEQVIKGQQQLKQYNLAIDRFQSVQSKLPLLNSIIESGKLQFALNHDGLLSVITRGVLTKSEADLVADMRTIGEDVNLIRGPLGATGFRGPEAWARLQQQAGGGNLLRHPEITKQVIHNTIQALQNQREPLANNPQLRGGETNSSTKSPNDPLHITLSSGKTVTIQ